MRYPAIRWVGALGIGATIVPTWQGDHFSTCALVVSLVLYMVGVSRTRYGR